MKVYIGPYTRWIGPYQIAKLIRFIGFNEDKQFEFGEWLAKTFVSDLCEWIDSKKKKTVKVRIDNYDTWNADHTLALIIVPLLKKLRETKMGSAIVQDEDLPDHLKVGDVDLMSLSDTQYIDRWNWILDEMIWAFESYIEDNSFDLWEGFDYSNPVHIAWNNAFYERQRRGVILFGKYYGSLWD